MVHAGLADIIALYNVTLRYITGSGDDRIMYKKDFKINVGWGDVGKAKYVSGSTYT